MGLSQANPVRLQAREVEGDLDPEVEGDLDPEAAEVQEMAAEATARLMAVSLRAGPAGQKDQAVPLDPTEQRSGP
jgi:hypothetical protein